MATKILTTKEVCEIVGGRLVGQDDLSIASVNSIDAASDRELTFLSDLKYLKSLLDSEAGAVLVHSELDNIDKTQIIVKNVDEALIIILEYFSQKIAATPGIHPSAIIEESAKIADSASIGANVVIGDNSSIGENTVISSGCSIGNNSTVGSNCRLDSNVVIYDNCTIGNYCVLQANATIGSVGFGYRAVNNIPTLIPHLGGVILEDLVEIGANSVVDRAKFGNTVIGYGTKIDNLVQIAHNCVIGKCCIIAGASAIGGSAILGDGVVVGGQVGIGDHATIGDGAMLAARSLILKKVPAGAKYLGQPARDIKKAQKVLAHTNRLPKLADTVKQLIKKVEKLEAAKDNS